MNLTPYDTGVVAEPHIWPHDGETDRYGRVDFDNDESATVATVHVTRNANGTHTLNVTGEVTINHDYREV